VRVGLAVADAVDALLGRVETRLKWPNDVLLGSASSRGSCARAAGTARPCNGWR